MNTSLVFKGVIAKRTVLCFVAMLMLMLLSSAQAVTVATFADPTANSSTSSNTMFTIDLVSHTINAGWPDLLPNLNLEIGDTTYYDAYFTMTTVSYAGNIYGGTTGGGTIKFFKNNQNSISTPLIQISFQSASISPYSLGAANQFFAPGSNVVITGSEVTGSLTNDACFSFSFANQMPKNGDWNNGYTVTAAFTSSAEVPEPASLGLFGVSWLMVLIRKRQTV